jgi:hexosaminidase
MEKHVNSKGKTLIGWDEILEGGLAPNAVVMSWRGEQGGIDAAKQNHTVIMTPGGYVYLDHSQTKKEDSVTIGGYLPLETVYGYDPVPKDLPTDKAKFVLGAQGNLWTEYISNARKVEYMIFPRMSALSEVLWTPKQNKDWNDFQKRLPTQFKRYELWKANYSKAFYQLKSTVSSTSKNDGLNWALDSRLKCKGCEIKLTEMVPDRRKDPSLGIYLDSTYEYRSPITIRNSRRFEAVLLDNKKVVDQLVEDFYITKATGKKISLTKDPIATYPGEGGAFGLVNGLESTNGIISSEWLGWRGDDMEAVIDLSKSQSINKVQVHALSRGGSRVYPPVELQVQTSTDGNNFSSAGSTTQFEQDANEPSGNMTVTFNAANTRFVKVIAKNYQKIPEGKTGAGDPALMLIDEIVVE